MNRLLLSLAALLLLGMMTVQAQAPNPPGPTDGVPVDGGLTIFLGLGAAYSARKVYRALKDQHED